MGIFALEKYPNQKKIKKEFYVLTTSYLCILVIFAYCMGSDAVRYTNSFKYIPVFKDVTIELINHSEYELGWFFLNVTAKSLFNDFFLVNLLSAGLLNIVVFYFFYKYSRYPFICLLLYFFLSFIRFSFEILRQDVATIFFLWGIIYLLKGNKKAFMLIALPCVLFHKSGLFVYFLTCIFMFIEIKKFMLIIPIVFFFVSTYIAFIFLDLVSIMNNLSLDYSSSVEFYANSDRYGVAKYEFISLLFIFTAKILIPTLIILNNIKNQKNYVWNQLLYIYMLTIGLSQFLVIFYRFSCYFDIIYYITVCNYTMYKLKRWIYNHKVQLGVPIVIATFAYNISSNIRVVLWSENFSNYPQTIDFRYYPYTSIFDKDDPIIAKRNNNFLY